MHHAKTLRTKRRHSMFWRVYLHGLLLLVVIAVTVAVISAIITTRPYWHEAPQRAADRLAETMVDDASGSRLLEQQVRSLAGLLLLDLTVYTLDNRLVATSSARPAKPFPLKRVGRLRRGGMHGSGPGIRAFPMYDGDKKIGYVVVGFHPGAEGAAIHRLVRAAAGFVAVLLALALASVPLVRTIVSPLERLTKSVRSFGEGRLSTRSGIDHPGEVGQLARAFDDMAARIEHLILTEKELLANVSHELRTPLARIRVALELAEEGDTEEARRYLGEMSQDVLELDRLVSDVLASTRLDLVSRGGSSGSPALHVAQVQPADLISQAISRFRRRHPERRCDQELERSLPDVDADPVLIRRVLDNLLENAAKYSDTGQPIVVAAALAQGEISIEVTDRGGGVSPEDLPHLFEPFFRADASRSRDSGGVGLGLTLARRIVEAHQGNITAESKPGEGTTIRFTLPARSARPAQPSVGVRPT